MLSMLMLVFSISNLISGIFTAYFGSAKSRVIGLILVIIGLIVGLLFLWFSWCIPLMGSPPIEFCGCITNGISAVVGAIIGGLVSLGLFLGAIMKT
jgi:hypothetical protein